MSLDMTESVSDVFVIGGGPAGSTAAALLAMHGRRVTLADKDVHPRFHIGESLLPQSVPLFRRLGVLEEVERIGVPKLGADFVSQYHGRTHTFWFAKAFDESLPSSFHVARAEFDKVLITRAADCGVDVVQGCEVTAATRDDSTGVWTLEGRHAGLPRRWHARYVLDASGRDTFFAGRQGWKVANPDHTSAAMFTHYAGVPRSTGPDAGNIQLYWFAHGWFWAIPLNRDITSIGAVCWPQYLKSRTGPIERFFDDTVSMAPDLARRLEGATRAADITATGNYSYKSSRIGGPGYLLIGDAYGFVDPLFSTGVLLAMESAASAADRVHRLLDTGTLEGELMREHAGYVDQAMQQFEWLIHRMPNPIMRDLIMMPDERIRARRAVMCKRAVISLLSGDVFGNSLALMREHLRNFKLVYYWHCLTQPLRWLRFQRFRRAYLSG
jgi:flavin-dependent dehydrogenase